LIAYSSFPGAGSVSIGTLPGTFTGYVTNDSVANTVFVVVTNGPVTAKVDQWGGAVNGSWDTTTLNWTNAGVAVAYAENDAVVFTDGAHTGTVSLSTAHTPSDVTFTNDSLTYTLNGSGSISGTSLLVGGTGSVTLAESGGDAISGGITVNSGTLILDDANNTNTSSVIISPGAVVQIGNNDAGVNPPSGTFTDDGTLTFEKTDGATISNTISGSGALNQSGSGELTLAADNSSFTGNVTVSGGTLALIGSGAVSNSPTVTIGTGAGSPTLDISGVSSGVTALNTLDLDNAVLTLGTTNLPTPLNVTALNMSGTANTINVTALPAMASFPTTVTLVQSQGAISGYNAVLGTIPAGFAGNLTNNTAINAIQLVVTSGTVGQRPFVLWSGADVPNLNTNWSDNANWDLPGEPVAGDTVIFGGAGSSGSSALSTPGGGIGALTGPIDNIANASFTLSSLTFTNFGGAYHNTFINPGDVLSITNSGLNIGAVDTGSSPASTEFVTISGTKASLSVNNTNANAQVWLGDASGSQATLDMSALDSFNMTGSRLLVGATINNVVNRPSGILYLAKTNNVTVEFQTTSTDSGTTTANGGIVVADCNANAGTASSVYLGLVNNITADTIGIGRQKATGNLLFNPIYANVAPYPTVTFQGFSASSISAFELGNGAGNSGTTSADGKADLTGGIVNGNVNTLTVGRASSAGGTTGGTTTGTLNFDAGTINANTLYAGVQPVSEIRAGVGSVGVASNTIIGMPATLNVSGSINLGFATGGTGATTTSGTLNITNGTVSANSVVAGTNGNSTINLIGGRLFVTNTIGSAAAPLVTLNLNPLNTPDNSNTVLTLPANTSASAVVSNLTIDGQATTTNELNISSVTTVTPPAELPVIQYTNLINNGGTFNIGLGTLPAGYNGYLTNDTSSNTIAVVITSVPVVAPSTNATITRVSLSGSNLVIQGTNNNVPNTSFHYQVLAATNLAMRLTNWTILSTNSFNPDGTFNYTNPIVPGTPRQFLDVKVVP
jgi:autotransporter-associated beta strand protein